MKKVFLSLYLFMAALNSPISAAVNDSIGSKINLQFVLPYTDPRNPYGHAPVRAPQASIDDHTLYLWDARDFLVYIKEEDEDGNEQVVYSAFVSASETTVNLPADLYGTYIIEVIRGEQCFVGEIELY